MKNKEYIIKTLPHKEFDKNMILEKKLKEMKKEKKKEVIPEKKKEKKVKEEIKPVIMEDNLKSNEGITFGIKEKSNKLPDRIEDFLMESQGNKEMFHSKELFRANREDVDIKTELTDQEIVLINKLIFNNNLLKEAKMNPIYEDFLYNYMRLKISRKRQSRGEFVELNKMDKSGEALDMVDKLTGITSARK